jgi:hypothetical protein
MTPITLGFNLETKKVRNEEMRSATNITTGENNEKIYNYIDPYDRCDHFCSKIFMATV